MTARQHRDIGSRPHPARLGACVQQQPILGPQPYDWGASDLPLRIKQKGGAMAFEFKLRPPPREIVFVDRKLVGVFFVLNRLRVRWDGRGMLQRYLEHDQDR